MAAGKPSRPKAGLGLSSALGRDQIATRKSAKATTRKPNSARSAKPKRQEKSHAG